MGRLLEEGFSTFESLRQAESGPQSRRMEGSSKTFGPVQTSRNPSTNL